MNKFLVGVHGDRLRIVNLPALAQGLTRDDALNLMGWLGAMAITLPGADNHPITGKEIDAAIDEALS